jgi:hypothetical protein
MNPNDMYEMMVEATRQAIRVELHSDDVRMSPRMFGGTVSFVDDEGRLIKEVEVLSLFKKITSVREKLRVLEQKVNNHSSLSALEKAELQVYITRSFGSLTTFNFLFEREQDKFRGTGG